MGKQKWRTVLAAGILAGFAATARPESFEFAGGLDGWNGWGTGEHRLVGGFGHAAPGCVGLQCGAGQEMTVNRSLELAPGRYRVSAWLRALDIREGPWGMGAWLFYAVSDEHQTVVKDLKGTFDWSRVTYTIDVPAGRKKAQFWFRLKAPGMLWIDDIAVEPHEGDPIAYRFEPSSTPFPRPNPVGEGVRCAECYRWLPADQPCCTVCGAPLAKAQTADGEAQTNPPERLLIGFEPGRESVEHKRHAIRETADTSFTEGARAGVIRFGRYNNLSLGDPEMRDWSGYEYIAFDVFNPLPTLERFSLAVNDKEGASYWDQLNHYTQLAPGWNRLRFPIRRYVGERGSVKVRRYLDLRNIRRVWFAVAPEDKRSVPEAFLADNIRLLKAPPAPAQPQGMQAFDFVQESFRAQPGFVPVQERHRYDPDVGFGLVEAEIWRSHDSVYADSLNRAGIFVLKGGFAVDVPPGRYAVYLCVNHLGYWNEHFWSRRSVRVEGREILSEERTDVASRLADFLRFQDIEPGPQDHPYDLYLRDLFRPLVTEADVTDGRLDIAVAGDASAVCLNWLIVAPAARRAEAEQYLRGLYAVQKDEFDNLARPIALPPRVDPAAIGERERAAGLYAALVDSDARVRPGDVLPGRGTAIRLEGGIGERPLQAVMVRNLGEQPARLRLVASPLVSEDGEQRIEPDPDWTRRAVNQYQCHTYNHETYELAPRFLRRLGEAGCELDPGRSLLVWFQVPVTAACRPGTYRGTLKVRLAEAETVYPVELLVHPYALPPLDVGVGFFGIELADLVNNAPSNAVPYRTALRRRVLEELARRGFTTWSGLPPAALVRRGDGWAVEAPEIHDLMAFARERGFARTVFTYGGGLGEILQLDARGDIAGLPQAEYRRVSAAALKEKAAGWLPISVTFSDEAAGYSSALARDMARADILEAYYPFLRRSGATSIRGEAGQAARELNLRFNDVLLSSQTADYAAELAAKGRTWGLYNVAADLFVYDRPAFGEGLYAMRRRGLACLLNWAMTFANNYPYYDLDGREYDAMMLFPRADGELCAALKFEWAAQGVEDCRLLLLLERLAAAAGARGAEARAWLDTRGSAVDPFADAAYMAQLTRTRSARECDEFRREIRRLILDLSRAGAAESPAP